MLRKLSINNFAIIENLSLELERGFIVLTGETGAGKSIIFDAIGLLFGERANNDLIRHGQQSARIEGCFSLEGEQADRIEEILEEHGCPFDDELHIKRVINQKGRSRVFINGSLTSLKALQEIAKGFLDIIGQHASHALLDTQNHLPLLDMFAQQMQEAKRVEQDYHHWKQQRNLLQRLEEQEQSRRDRLAAIEEQLDRIDMAQVSLGEDERLTKELDRLLNAETLREKTTMVSYILQSAEGAVTDQLATALEELRRVAYLDDSLQKTADDLDKLSIDLGEHARDIQRFAETVSVSPEEIEILQDRLDLIQHLKHQFGGSIESVLHSAAEIQKEADALSAESAQIIPLRNAVDALHEALQIRAQTLSAARQAASIRMSQLVETELKQLGMPHCRFQIRFHEDTIFSSDGLDRVEFFIAPNPGEGFKELARVASGGELSRLLLALKVAIIERDPVETYIFDEVDTGIGGAIAQIVGKKLRKIGEQRQALCITHLAQVACCATHHLHVSKTVVDGRTSSEIRFLSPHERVYEVARMLGGTEITQRSLAHAQELLSENNSNLVPLFAVG
ncbi:MAG: DNA repair protein RecN [Myxococcota bacterium]|nr:DNA repair protein RecN [Myxococcota bacterium]